MKSLDEILSEKAQVEFKDKLAEVLDPSTWTEENRESKLKEVRTLAESVCDVTEKFVMELLETQVNGRSVLWNKIREQFISGEVELLLGFRDELDSIEDISTLPISYEWLNAKIKERYKEIGDTNVAVSKAMDPTGDVEEL